MSAKFEDFNLFPSLPWFKQRGLPPVFLAFPGNFCRKFVSAWSPMLLLFFNSIFDLRFNKWLAFVVNLKFCRPAKRVPVELTKVFGINDFWRGARRWRPQICQGSHCCYVSFSLIKAFWLRKTWLSNFQRFLGFGFLRIFVRFLPLSRFGTSSFFHWSIFSLPIILCHFFCVPLTLKLLYLSNYGVFDSFPWKLE